MNLNDPAILKAVLIARLDDLPESADPVFAAERLSRLNWQPEFLIPVPGFSLISADLLRQEVMRIFELDDHQVLAESGAANMEPEKVRLTQVTMMMNTAELLWRLRADDPEAWDHITELYDDD